MSISKDTTFNVNIDMRREYRKTSKKIREIHRLSIKSNKLSIDELNKLNRLPELELYLKNLWLNRSSTTKTNLSETIHTKPLHTQESIEKNYNNNLSYAEHTKDYPSTIGLYAPQCFLNDIISCNNEKKQYLTLFPDSSLCYSAETYRQWLLLIYNNDWEKYHTIKELDWICSFLESLN